MVETEKTISSEKETGRLEAFSDGVFAVAITFLAFNLKVPALDGPITGSKLAAALFDQWPSYASFLISFATILIMWVSHHNLFKLIHKTDNVFIFANGFLLLMVTVVPFPTGLVGAYLLTDGASVACATYAGIFVVISLAYNLLWWSVVYRRSLIRADVPGAQILIITRNYALGLPSYLLATVLAFWVPLLSMGLCAMLWIFWALTTSDQKFERKAGKPSVE